MTTHTKPGCVQGFFRLKTIFVLLHCRNMLHLRWRDCPKINDTMQAAELPYVVITGIPLENIFKLVFMIGLIIYVNIS